MADLGEAVGAVLSECGCQMQASRTSAASVGQRGPAFRLCAAVVLIHHDPSSATLAAVADATWLLVVEMSGSVGPGAPLFHGQTGTCGRTGTTPRLPT